MRNCAFAALAAAFSTVILLGGCARRDASGGAVRVYDVHSSPEVTSEPAASDAPRGHEEAASEGEDVIFVHILGAVRKPGVYELRRGDRVYMAVEAAGGLMEDAAPLAVNEARLLVDGEQIAVPTLDEFNSAREAEAYAAAEAGGTGGGLAKININTADAGLLMTLKGIGEARASDIIAYREKNGGFSSVEEIMKVSGIKHSVYDGIRDMITVG